MIFCSCWYKNDHPSGNGAFAMPLRKPFHITPQGGSILCLEGLAGRIFRACSANQCTYTGDLHSAKSFLDFIENNTIKFLPSGKKNEKIPLQRKTTLKWNKDGSLFLLIWQEYWVVLKKTFNSMWSFLRMGYLALNKN